jgi:hypothetical protein
MASRPQQSKRDRGRQHEGLPPRLQPPKYGYCPDCSQPIHNRGAHAEACTGIHAARRCEARVPGYGHGVYRYCVRQWNHEGGHIYR